MVGGAHYAADDPAEGAHGTASTERHAQVTQRHRTRQSSPEPCQFGVSRPSAPLFIPPPPPPHLLTPDFVHVTV